MIKLKNIIYKKLELNIKLKKKTIHKWVKKKTQKSKQ
jgi:transposase-like protein